jgi:hypothetical protein
MISFLEVLCAWKVAIQSLNQGIHCSLLQKEIQAVPAPHSLGPGWGNTLHESTLLSCALWQCTDLEHTPSA